MTQPIKTIWLDMDGVVADFATSLLKLFDLDLKPEDITGYNTVSSHLGCEKKFWKGIHDQGPDFWADLNLYPRAYELVEFCEDLVGEDEVFFLTAPSTDPSSIEGKLMWVKKYFPKYHEEQRLCPFLHKERLAGPDQLLIDDFVSNIEKWEEQGGHGILYPRPWNGHILLDSMSHELVIESIQDILGR